MQKKISTIKKLKNYPEIYKASTCEIKNSKNLMFFDYPTSKEEYFEILKVVEPKMIHVFKEEIELNLKEYVRKITGMLKFVLNKKQGEFEIQKMAESLGVDVQFVENVLEILTKINVLEIKNGKVSKVLPLDFEKFERDYKFPLLKEEFLNILEFKKNFFEVCVK